jgi:hypothetical protein
MTRARFLPAAAALLLVAVASAQTSATGPFTPNLSNDTVILCQGWSDEELGQILSGFRSTYRAGLGPVFSLNTHALTESEMSIRFPHDISPRLLAILVNYLQYPPGVAANGRSIAVLGKVTLTSAYPLPSPAYAGKVAHVYVPANDRSRDVVYFAVSGEFFEESLADGSAKTVSDGRIPPAVQSLW